MTVKNLLFIAIDDLFSVRRHRSVYGITIQTPNLDRLLAGCDFRAAFAPIALCAPVRAAVMSGYTPWQLGLLNNETEWSTVLQPSQMWRMRLREAGFYMVSAGKIDHGYSPDVLLSARMYDVPEPQFTDDPGTEDPFVDYGGEAGGKGYTSGDEKFFDYQVAEYVANFLATYDGDRPFYCGCGFRHPHSNWDLPERFFTAIDHTDIVPPADWNVGWDAMTNFAENMFAVGDYHREPPSAWNPTQLEEWQKTVRNYIAAIHHMDEHLGTVLDALEASDHADNTLIVCYSDHGYELYSHAHIRKFTLWEQACIAPFFIVDPDHGARAVEAPVSMLDIGPTILDYFGLSIPAGRQGISLKGVVQGTATADPDRMVPTAWYGSVSGTVVVDGVRYRVTLYQTGEGEMFRLDTDPWCQVNIAATNPTLFAALRTLLLLLAEAWGIRVAENGVDVSKPTPFASYVGLTHDDEMVVGGRAYVSYDDLMPANIGRGRQRWWGYPGASGAVLRIPVGVEEYGAPWASAIVEGTFTVVGNEGPNTIDLVDTHVSSNITLRLRGGDDVVLPIKCVVNIDLGPGNDYVMGGGDHPMTLAGGAGADTIVAGSGADSITGGSGADSIVAGGGADTIAGGDGADLLRGEGGADVIIVDAGADTVYGGSEADTFRIRRTGRVVTIADFASGDADIDLSDWAGIQPVTVTQVSGDVEITAALERIVLTTATRSQVVARITGATVAP
jgi:arylsulfatase A-like enzyme